MFLPYITLESVTSNNAPACAVTASSGAISPSADSGTQREEAKKGKAVLYVSSDLTELLEVADAVAVMTYGRVRKTFENKDLKPTDVLACCYEAEREESD